MLWLKIILISNGEYSGQKCIFMPHPGNLRSLIYVPFFAVFRDIARSKIYQISLTEVKNCQIVEIRLLNMKINKEKL